MLRTSIYIALSVGAAAVANAASAETTGFEGPPPWRDNESVYLNAGPASSASAPELSEATHLAQGSPKPDRNSLELQTVATPPESAPTPPPFDDPSVQRAFHQPDVASPTIDENRRLPPPTATSTRSSIGHADATETGSLRKLGPPLESISTTLAALAVVIGCFLTCTWLVRRGTRKSTAALPAEVVSVLGRVPLAARNVAQLLRVGNKLVLVSITPAGTETLTEVTDPAEVDRLVGLCQQSDPHSTTKAFEHVLRQMSFESAPSGFLGQESPFGSATRGGAARA